MRSEKITEQPEVMVEEQIPGEPLSKEPLQEQIPATEEEFEQDISDQPTTKAMETISENPRDIGIDKVAEVDVLAQVAVGSSSPKDDISLFPEILSGTVTAKTIEQTEVALKQVALDQPQGDDFQEEQVLLEQIHPTEVLYFMLAHACGYHVP